MLREIYSTRQNHQHRTKRWFTDANMDLFVWFRNQRPVCFQLCYKKCLLEHSISWHIQTGLSHSLIRPEHRHIKYRLPASSAADEKFDATIAASEFLRASEHIETTLADFIFARLLEFPRPHEIRSNPAFVSANS